MTTVNFMPAYKQAPTALDLLSKRVDEAIAKAGEEDITLILPSTASELAERLPGVKVVLADASIGFLYSNVTATRNLLAGEKPFPTAATLRPGKLLSSGLEWLEGEGETRHVWVEGSDAPVELPRDASVRDILAASSVSDADVKAVYLGYPASRFVPASALDDPQDLATFDLVRVYTSASCMANALREVVGEFVHEGCGCCVLGHEGGYQIDVIMNKVCSNKASASDVALLRDLCPVMGEHALCELGQTLARTVSQALDLFGDEIEQHYAKHQCPAGECRAYMTYHVLVSRCTGCGKCLPACEEDAIMGKARFVHVIDQRACTKCGACLKACPEGAIVMAGAKKPKTPPKPIPCKVH